MEQLMDDTCKKEIEKRHIKRTKKHSESLPQTLQTCFNTMSKENDIKVNTDVNVQVDSVENKYQAGVVIIIGDKNNVDINSNNKATNDTTKDNGNNKDSNNNNNNNDNNNNAVR